ncbi:type VI secretion system protein TssA [Janthinobacterium sp.]|uniref:type VI secretion system protein TssA n=1 Tax=Janthinobacterium sp. TaxID=1871054 RepID=UPI0028990B87|nr:type VI secretion system protein TssA [Janthinobacterium sp.]
MIHPTKLQSDASSYFETAVKFTLDDLLAPISPDMPAGKWVRDNPAYRAIRRARSFDDDSTPRDAWEHELKRADWLSVSRMTTDVLCRQSKDIECVAWLLEARLHMDGFAAIAPCLTLLDLLLGQYWDSIYPLPDGDDLDFRANQISWINAKLLPALRLTPVTASAINPDGTQYSWSDWEQAQRNAQIKARSGSGEQIEGATLALFQQSVAGTSTDYYQQLRRTLADALQALGVLDKTLDACFGRSAPSMAAMASLLEKVLAFADGELQQRGIRPVQAREETPAAGPASAAAPAVAPSAPAPLAAPALASPIRDREDAYARLAELSEYLMRLEPHSPGPYLLRRAVQWGQLDTAQLYHEIFIRSNGMLSIFELLGVEVPEQGR